jgi:hypothetical protein
MSSKEVVIVLRLDVAEGVASDFWGDEFLLGGEAMTRISPPFSSEPLDPVDADLTSMRPSPGLATRLAKLPTSDVSDSHLVDVIGAYQRLISWAQAGQVAAIAELTRRPMFLPHRDRDERDELRSAGAQAAAELRLAPSTGEDRALTARRLVEEFTATLGALREGAIDYRRAAMITDVVDRRDVATAHKVAQRVLPRAGARTLGQHRRAIERAILEVDPVTAEERHRVAEAVRRIEFWPGDEGMGHALVTMPADGMALFRSTLDGAAQAMKSARDDGRTMDQLRVDALIELSRRALAAGRFAGGVEGIPLSSAQGRRPNIQVTVPFSTLIGIDDHPGELTGYGPIPASVARRLARNGVWRRLLTDPATGRLIDYGTTRYTPPQDLRDVIIARDQTCVFPTCSQPAHRCQIDHTIPYPDGPTSQTNTGPPCGIHHDLKTHRGWLLEQPEEGLFIWTSPVGKRYENEPPQVGPIIEIAPPNDNSASADPPTTEGPDPPDVPPF